MSQELFIDVSLGLVGGVTAVNKFGRNADIDIGTEDIWGTGGTWAAPATASVVNFASSDAADAAAGTGCRTISVTGLDSNYNEITETVTMNGATPVATVNGYWIIHRVYALTAGSGGTNAGTITGTSAAAGTPVLITMSLGVGQTQFGIYQVPLNKTLLIIKMGASSTTTGTVNVSIFAKPFGGVFNLKRNYSVNATGSSSVQYEFSPPLKFTEKTIVKMTGTASANNSDVSANWDGLLFDNSYTR